MIEGKGPGVACAGNLSALYWSFMLMCVCVWQGTSGRHLDQSGHVGFDSLPDQLVNKAVKKGFDFNILCIGKPEHVLASECEEESLA